MSAMSVKWLQTSRPQPSLQLRHACMRTCARTHRPRACMHWQQEQTGTETGTETEDDDDEEEELPPVPYILVMAY